jgi:hypothetical protein
MSVIKIKKYSPKKMFATSFTKIFNGSRQNTEIIEIKKYSPKKMFATSFTKILNGSRQNTEIYLKIGTVLLRIWNLECRILSFNPASG